MGLDTHRLGLSKNKTLCFVILFRTFVFFATSVYVRQMFFHVVPSNPMWQYFAQKGHQTSILRSYSSTVVPVDFFVSVKNVHHLHKYYQDGGRFPKKLKIRISSPLWLCKGLGFFDIFIQIKLNGNFIFISKVLEWISNRFTLPTTR